MTKKRTSIAIILIFLFIIFLWVTTNVPDEKERDLRAEAGQFLDIGEIGANYYRGEIKEIIKESKDTLESGYIEQKIRVEISNEDRKGEEVFVNHRSILDPDQSYRFNKGDKVVLNSHIIHSTGEEVFYIADYDRINGLLIIFVLFLGVIFYFGRARGVGSVLGLGFSMLVLIYYMIPNIISGSNPLQVTLLGAILIASVSLFLAHGINNRTPIVWLSTVTTLFISIFVSYFFVEIASLFGRGGEFVVSFQLGEYSYISLRGLLLAGMVVGVLGVLSDVTSTQTAVVWELKKANKKLNPKELYVRSLNVGREHIASLVNTLVLVYAGASLPLFIILYSTEYMPLWVSINSEPIAEEIARAIIGSTSLILAVPISSIFAAYFIGRKVSQENISVNDSDKKN